MAVVDLAFAPGVTAPRAARVEVCSLAMSTHERDIVGLLVSELVTNAVLHAGLGVGQRIRVRGDITEGAIRIEVIDGGTGTGIALRDPKPDGGGWGLHLVDELAHRWGVAHAAGTHVWFELDRS